MLAAQVSPGPLARAHAELEGTLNCTNCHGGDQEAMSGRCSSCHKDIAWLRERNRGFHGKRETKGETCAACHPDHAGLDFDLIKWPEGSPERFDHQRAGWRLKQRHAQARCEACHGVDAFAPAAKFDHTRDAAFSTRGAHEHVPCNQCHPTDLKSGTSKALIYRPVSAKCESCHGKEAK